MSDKVNKNIQLLWEDFLNGNDEAFSAIYFSYIDDLLLYGRKLTFDRELIHDSLQEVFLNIYQKSKKEHISIKNLKAYLFAALRNGILMKILKNKKVGMSEINNDVIDKFHIEYNPQEKIINQEITEETHIRLQKAIKDLSPRQKEIIYLKFEEDLSYIEIAAIMNITVESARKQLYRSLVSLRNILDNKNSFSSILF